MRILLIYPNLQSETMVPTSLAIFSSLFKGEGFEVELFDTTDYEVETDFMTGLELDGTLGGTLGLIQIQNVRSTSRDQMKTLAVRPFKVVDRKKTTNVYQDLRKKVDSFGPNLLVVTATENMFPMAINLLSFVRDFKIPTILGGVFATFAPDLCMRWKVIDMLCVGEGEYALVDLCNRIKRGEDYSTIPGLWVRMPDGSIKKNPMVKTVDMNENPSPDFTLFEDARFYRPMSGKIYRMFPVETHRGCPYTCRFCNSPAQNFLYTSMTQQMFFRKKSFENIRKELLFLRDVWRAEYFFFWADTFFAWSEREFDQFCEMYQDIKMPFWCQTRPETVTNQRMMKLKEVGLHKIAFGIEHGNEKFRKEVIDRAYTNQLVIEKMKIVNDLQIHFNVNNIIGFPMETRELAFDTIRLNAQIRSDTLSCSIFTPYHGTELRAMAVNLGYVHPDLICPTNADDSVLDMPPPYMSKEQMRNLRRVFSLYAKFPESRWREIQVAESTTPEGVRMWEKLREEFIQAFFSGPDNDNMDLANIKT